MSTPQSTPPRRAMSPACNGTDQRLDAILEELQAVRQLLDKPALPEPQEPHIAQLREPATPTLKGPALGPARGKGGQRKARS